MVKVEIQSDLGEDLAYVQARVTLVTLFTHLNQFFNFENGSNNSFSSYFIGFEDQVR